MTARAMPTQRGDLLRALLAQRTKALVDQAIGSEGRVSLQDVEALEPLARLAEMRDRTRQPKRYPLLLTLLATLALLSVLVFVPVRSTEVELDLAVSELSFVLPVDYPITESLEVTSLGVSGLTAIDLPRSTTHPAATLQERDLLLSSATIASRQGTITLASITLPAGTRVAVRAGARPQEYRLSFRARTPQLTVSVDGPIEVVVPDTDHVKRDFAVPRQLVMWLGTDVVDLVFTTPEVSRTVFLAQLPADSLHLSRIDEYTSTTNTVARHVSTILSGTVYMESIDGLGRALRRSEGIRLGTSTGAIRQLALAEDHLALQFHGRVSGMSSGSATVRRSMMPTILEWLRARHGLSLLWGTTAYVFGLALGALRWWRSPQ